MTFLDRIKETSTSTGTGAFTLGGAVLGYKVFSNGTYKYCIVNETESEWEVGEGTVASGVLTRTTIEASSNGGAAVVFTAGTKYVFNTVSAAYVNSLVPYTGATASVNLGSYGLTSDYYQLSTTPTASGAVGRMLWNDTDGTMDIGLKGGNVTLQVGQEQVVRVVNKVGSTLTEAAYQAVYISGAQGQRPKVALAQANVDATSASTIGLVTETIADNQEGFITTSGIVRGINTTGSLQGETWADGDIVYLSPTTAGQITNVKPTAPNHTVIIGYVVYAHATQGKIFVKVDNGYEIGELHDVYAPSPATGNGLFWNATNSRYELNTINGVLGYTAADDSLVVHLAGAENITGVKTFQNALKTTTGDNLLNTGGGNTYVGYTATTGTPLKFNVKDSIRVEYNANRFVDIKVSPSLSDYAYIQASNTTGLQIVSSGNIYLVPSDANNTIYLGSYLSRSDMGSNALYGSSAVAGYGLLAGTEKGIVFKTNISSGGGIIGNFIFHGSDYGAFAHRVTASTTALHTIKTTGQLQLHNYTSTSVFTGTVAGLLGFDSSGNVITTSASAGITGSGTAGQVTYWSGTSAVSGSSNLVWDNTNGRLGIGVTSPASTLHIQGASTGALRTTGGPTVLSGGKVSITSGGSLSGTNAIEIFNSTAGDLFKINDIGSINIYGSITTSAGIALTSSASIYTVKIGGTVSGSHSVTIGNLSQCTTSGIAIGYQAASTGDRSVALGNSTTASANNSIAIGYYSNANVANSFVAGYYTTTYQNPITNVYFGSGIRHAETTSNPIDYTINGTGAPIVYNANGGNVGIAGGKGSGTGTPGQILFYTSVPGASSSSLQSLVERARFTSSGYFAVGQTSATALVDIAGSTTSTASFRIRSGTAPTTPNDGEIWYDGTNIYIRVGTTTKTFTIL